MNIGPLIVALAPLPILAVVVAIFLFARGSGANLAPGDVDVPLRAAFGSLRGLGPFAGTRNNLNPMLILRAGGVEYRVLRRTTATYPEIASVDGAPGRFGSDIVLIFADNYRFTGRTRDRVALAAALRLLRSKGCPLTAAAATLADGSAG